MAAAIEGEDDDDDINNDDKKSTLTEHLPTIQPAKKVATIGPA